jgi:VanZ family protein
MNDARTRLWLRRAFFVCVALAFVMALVPQAPSLPLKHGSKVEHMLAFLTLGALAAAGWRERSALAIFAVLAILGGALESFQAIPALNRDAEWLDWIADMAAAIIAIVLVRWLFPRL